MSDSKEPKLNVEQIMREYTLKFQKLIAMFQMLSQMDMESFDSMYKNFAELQADISKSMESLDQLREAVSKFECEDEEYEEEVIVKPPRSRRS